MSLGMLAWEEQWLVKWFWWETHCWLHVNQTPGQSGPSRQPFRNNVLLQRAWKLLQLAAFITHLLPFSYLEVGFILKTNKDKGKVSVYADMQSSFEWWVLAMHAGRPVPPVRDSEYGPRQAAGSYKNSSIIQFWSRLSTLHISSIILQAVLLKEHFKVENKEKKFPSQSLIKGRMSCFCTLIGWSTLLRSPHWPLLLLRFQGHLCLSSVCVLPDLWLDKRLRIANYQQAQLSQLNKQLSALKPNPVPCFLIQCPIRAPYFSPSIIESPGCSSAG